MDAETHYKKILGYSERMLDAGKKNAWDLLAQIEAERSALLLHPPAIRGSQESDKVRELIVRIQACDDELKSHILPLIEQIKKLLRIESVSGSNTD